MAIQCLWPSNSADLPLLPGEIHVWSARLDCAEPFLERFAATLSVDETARANRFFLARDRSAFIAAHGILRQLLASYLHHAPADLHFGYQPRGKPFLVPHFRYTPLEFNIAHSHGLALLAFSLGSAVGVDVEFVRSDIASEEIAERYFAPQEVAELRSLPPAQRQEGFFSGWTRKEAYLKALGDGLQIPLASFRVSLTPSQPAVLESADNGRWSLHSLCPAQDFAGALVAEGKDWRVRCLNLTMNYVS
jgi:4'-phosphopantetheinyl transferase